MSRWMVSAPGLREIFDNSRDARDFAEKVEFHHEIRVRVYREVLRGRNTRFVEVKIRREEV